MPRISYRTNIKNLEAIEKLAIEQGITVNALITAALALYMARHGIRWQIVRPGRPKKRKGGKGVTTNSNSGK